MHSIIQARPKVQPQMVSGNQKKTHTEDEHSTRMWGKAEQGREELLFTSTVAQSQPKPPTKKNDMLFNPQTTVQETVNDPSIEIKYNNNSVRPHL